MVSVWLFFLLLAILYNHLIMHVGLFGHSAVVFHVFMFFLVFMFCRLSVWLCFFSDIIDLFSCIAASRFNKLIYLLTYVTVLSLSPINFDFSIKLTHLQNDLRDISLWMCQRWTTWLTTIPVVSYRLFTASINLITPTLSLWFTHTHDTPMTD